MGDGTLTLSFEKETVDRIVKRYLLVVQDLIKGLQWDGSKISVSLFTLSDSIAEAVLDVKAMKVRRKPDSISLGKIAGIFTFRLCRRGPIFIHEELIEDEIANKINLLAAMAFSLKYLINVDIAQFPRDVTRELQYCLAKRHTNQETLGLVYDTMRSYLNGDD